MNAIIVSLSINPGHLSHLIAGYKLCQDLGYTSYLYIDEPLKKYIQDTPIQYFSFKNKQIELDNKNTFVLFWSPSIKNFKAMIQFKFKFRAKIGYVLHEPFDSIKNYYKAGFNIRKVFNIIFSNIINIAIVRISTFVLLPSLKSYQLYHQNKLYLINKNAHLFSLILDDESLADSQQINNKNKISYIGTIAEDHAFNEYLLFVQHCIKNNLFLNLNFLIATKSSLEKYHELIQPLLNSKRVKILSGVPLTNKEINQCFNESVVVWNAYHRSNQSGVLSKAFMYGTPILVLKKNINEYTEDRKNCILISDNKSIEELINAVNLIVNNFPEYSNYCRKTFIKHFYYKSKMNDLLNILRPNNCNIE